MALCIDAFYFSSYKCLESYNSLIVGRTMKSIFGPEDYIEPLLWTSPSRLMIRHFDSGIGTF